MGTSYQAMCYYGIGTLEASDEGLEPTVEVLKQLGFDSLYDWLDSYTTSVPFPKMPSNTSHEQARQKYKEYEDKKAQLLVEKFGCVIDTTYSGLHDYPAYIIYVKESMRADYMGGVVPVWPEEKVEEWRLAMERVRAILPGFTEPALRFDFSAG